ncbi:FxsA family protein [Streptomyces sp. Vc74B-19]|uniref:FxsA family membrane protein n=1 Tax=unclassified Streptomyces TaxID=2593676 RepID=UPI001BFC588F|nr:MULTISPECIES: FxsA family membrane protein [unclassified Streptomyces]MBT3163398.1 FxsA family protein [Streptomyces sp. Vc74B-19]MCO4694757.1 FxsA family protein [Streptomyces sp. RO-S4]MDU0299006.1 FxsA family membrane protein [Streptomyces sp. PAL114]
MTTGAQTPNPVRPRRSRLRTLLPLGVAVWLVLEIWLLTLVAGASNGLVVFLVLVAGVVLGSVVIKRAGRRAFKNLSETLQQQQNGTVAPGSRPNSEGNGLMMLGGLLLIIPGLVSDALGLLLLVPPVQKAVSRYAERTFERKLREAAASQGSLGDAFQQARMRRPDGKVVQGEVIRDEPGSAPGDTPQGPPPPLTR